VRTEDLEGFHQSPTTVLFFLKIQVLCEGGRLRGLLSTTYPHREKSFEVEGWTQRWRVYKRQNFKREIQEKLPQES